MMFQRRAYNLCVSAALLLAVIRCRTDHIPTAPGIVAVSLTPPAATLRLGTAVQLNTTVTVDGRTTARPVRFESSDPSVVNINSDGLLRALRIGFATVTATSDASAATAVVTVIAGLPASITKTAGDSQVTAAGTVVAIPPTVSVRDSAGNPVGDVLVTFSGTGAVVGASATTDVNGVASVTSWTLGNDGGVNVLTATVEGLGYVTFTAKGTAPTIEVGTPEVTESRPAGSLAPITQLVTITNAGSGTLGGLAVGAITFDGARGWLTATVDGPTAPTNLRLAANPAGLPVGTYSAAVPVVAANAMNRLKEVVFTLTIDAAPTATALASSVNPSSSGQGVTLTATVTAAGITPSGSVQFKDGDVPIGAPVPLNPDGTASLVTSALALANSPHALTAEYGGDSRTKASTSPALRQVVQPAATTVQLTSNASVVAFGTSVTFTATVTSTGDTPSGMVEFRDGSTVLGSATLTAGVATFSTLLTPRPHAIIAVYTGDANHATSSSSSLSQQVSQGISAVTLVTSGNPAVVGTVLTLTATVSGAAGVPTGNVTFKDGASTLGTVALIDGAAVLATSALTVRGAPHAVTATYDGDGTYGAATSSAISQVIEPASTSVTVTSSPSTATPGIPVTFTATIRGTATPPTGTVTFKDGSAILGSASVVSGSATFTSSGLAATGRPHDITAEYSGDANNRPSGSAVLQQSVVLLSTSTTLSSSANPAVNGESITLTANVASTGANVSAGTIQFLDGGVAIGSPQTVSESGVASLTTSALSASGSPHAIAASYSGDAAHVASVSAPLSQVVEIASTVSTLSASIPASVAGERVTFTALVRGSLGAPRGTVQFTDGGVVLGVADVGADGVASFGTASLAPGTHAIAASYTGDVGYLASSSAVVPYTVSKATPSNTLSATALWQTTTLVARIVGVGFATPTGTVTFKDAGIAIRGPVPVVDGVATLSTLIPPFAGAPHSIVAEYSGDANYLSVTSAPLNYSITEATLTLERTAGANPSTAGSALTFTATAAAVDAGRPTPTGWVQFRIDGVDSGALVALVAGRASFTTSALTVDGSPHVVSAAYTGDINFKQAVSRGVSQSITP